MTWTVAAADEFELEFQLFPEDVKDELAALVGLLEVLGPGLNRPHCDTLKGSRFANMKELRFEAAGGVWRVAFAFDPERAAILLVAGDKSGGSEARFYRKLIRLADQRFETHLAEVKRR